MTQHTCIHKNASPQLATNDLKYASMNIETAWLSSEQGGILRYSRRGSGHCWTIGHALLPSWEEATAKRLARRNYIGKYNKP